MQRFFPGIFFLLLLGACSLDYEQAMIADELSEDVPETVLIDFTHSIVKDGKPLFIVSADRATSFAESKKTFMERAVFRQYNSEGDLVAEGSAENAVLYSATENVELEKNIYFYSVPEESSIEADYLYWDNEEGVLRGRDEETVTVRQDSGTRIRGTGFYAELYSKNILFRGASNGRWVEDEEE